MASFTALNDGSPKATSPVNGPNEIKPPPSEDRTPADVKPVTGEVSSNQREAWADRPPYQARYANMEGSQKRKRSNSVEPRREHPPPQPERSDESSLANSLTPSHLDSRDQYRSSHGDYRSLQYAAIGDESAQDQSRDLWYSQHSHNDKSNPQTQLTDDQSSDALRRSAVSQGDVEYPATSPDGEDKSMAAYEASFASEQKPEKGAQGDPKKRKRVFSNRTKTGCLTCRRRKKKCDEQKPECVNCLRGGFVCSGYQPQKGTWPKQEQKAVVVSIESKDPTYVPPGPYGMPQTNHFGQTVQQSSSTSSSLPAPYRGQPPLRINPPSHPVLNSEDDRPTASTLTSASVASPENKLSAISSSYTNTPGANVFPTPVSAVPTPFKERLPRVPPMHDISRSGESEHPTPISAQPKSAPQLPQIQILNPTRTSSPVSHATSTSAPSSNPQVAAQLALNHSSFPPTRALTQKEQMLRGRDYYPHDKELTLERERCSSACWRFNNSCNPSNGISTSERLRLFREILQPRELIQLSSTVSTPSQTVGRLGDQVRVDGPFHCEYGYNIQVGNNVNIGRNCSIMDSSEVRIGDNCHIGPNVAIYTASLPYDPKKRNQGTQTAKSVAIERDCWIGGNAIILPDVTIHKGSTVCHGAVVVKDVPPFTVVTGNPAEVLRGVME